MFGTDDSVFFIFVCSLLPEITFPKWFQFGGEGSRERERMKWREKISLDFIGEAETVQTIQTTDSATAGDHGIDKG
jgi:hypothetical protein